MRPKAKRSLFAAIIALDAYVANMPQLARDDKLSRLAKEKSWGYNMENEALEIARKYSPERFTAGIKWLKENTSFKDKVSLPRVNGKIVGEFVDFPWWRIAAKNCRGFTWDMLCEELRDMGEEDPEPRLITIFEDEKHGRKVVPPFAELVEIAGLYEPKFIEFWDKHDPGWWHDEKYA